MPLDLSKNQPETDKEDIIQVMMNSQKRQITKVMIVEEGPTIVLTIHFGPIPA